MPLAKHSKPLIMSLIEYAVLALATLFAIVSPISTAPIFLAITPDDTSEARSRMAKLACTILAIVLILFAIAGTFLLRTLGITISAFQAAGGILLLLIALDMLQAKDSSRKISREESQAGAEKEDVAITPLAVPLLAGPGAISTAILLANRAEGWAQRIALYGAIIIVSFATFLILKFASRGVQWLNPIFLRVTTRLMGLLLAALAVQFIFNGLLGSGLIAGQSGP